MNILIADDKPHMRRLIRAMVQTHGWVVCGEAENGRQAITRAKQCKPDVIVLDFAMPEINGIEAARQISPSTAHWQYGGVSYHAGYVLELPSAHQGNFTNYIGLVMREAPSYPVLFEWRVSFGFLGKGVDMTLAHAREVEIPTNRFTWKIA